MKNNFTIALNKIFTVFFFCIFISISLSAQEDKELVNAIPLEFNKNNDTLLIFGSNPFYRMSIKKHFKKYYTGNYIFVTNNKDLKKYSVESCRFILYEDITLTTQTTIGGSHNGESRQVVTHDKFRIEDRKNNINYFYAALFYAEKMKKYLVALDEASKNGLL